MPYIEKTYKFLSEKPSLKVFTGGVAIEFSPFYETKDENIAQELRKLPNIYEVDTSQNSVNAQPHNIIQRDEYGRAKVAEPSASDDIVNLSYLDTQLANKTNNGHQHTKFDVGLENVDNVADYNKPLSYLQKAYIDEQIEAVTSEGVPDATTSVKGKARFATDEEVNATLDYEDSATLNDVATITPKTLAIPIDHLKQSIMQNVATINQQAEQLKLELDSTNANLVDTQTELENTKSSVAQDIEQSETETNATIAATKANIEQNIASVQASLSQSISSAQSSISSLQSSLNNAISQLNSHANMFTPKPQSAGGAGQFISGATSTTHDLRPPYGGTWLCWGLLVSGSTIANMTTPSIVAGGANVGVGGYNVCWYFMWRIA